MQLNPYLSFNGRCEEAFTFYASCLDGEVVAMMTYGETPMADQMAPGWEYKIAHGRLMVGDKLLMGVDTPPDRYEAAKGFHVLLGFDDPEEAGRVFTALATDGTIQLPIAETFWAQQFGILIDRFGTPWMINCEKRADGGDAA
ncbi:VOC family protein [Glaciimonas immobilis]|uniref:PhnB protein n=1 Tax=Glaciimonas immobilis TaxID=728004 RepID=A0A840RSF7_9BURK|nr:VOC family protein [Glaciimonas immobilis]KAF3996827.1 VOC family protein [Glaciimonas immobilis]MBB5199624.1 PhnB protein [Glaciimonas immobilis]